MANVKQYSVLSGLVRDLERAIEDGGTVAWKLLSRFDNALFAIEEVDLDAADAAADDGMADDPDGVAPPDDGAQGPDEVPEQLALGGAGFERDRTRVEPRVAGRARAAVAAERAMEDSAVGVPGAGIRRTPLLTRRGPR